MDPSTQNHGLQRSKSNDDKQQPNTPPINIQRKQQANPNDQSNMQMNKNINDDLEQKPIPSKQPQNQNQNNISSQRSPEQVKNKNNQNNPSSAQNSNQELQQSLKSSQEQQEQKSGQEQDEQKSQKAQDDQKSQKEQQQDRSEQEQQRSGHDQEEQRSGQEGGRRQEPSGKRCFNKLCQSKKIYKKLRSKVQHAKYRFLCRPCYESYVSNDFCQFCQQIYSSTGNSEDDDQWIGCDECNRWNHIECEQKYRNKNIHQLKDRDDTPYLCLTCTYKAKQKSNIQSKQRPRKQYNIQSQQPRVLKPKIDFSKDQRIPVFNRKIQSLPNLEYFLQNYNFRLWINENLIKDDLQLLRETSKKSQDQGKRSTKKVKID